MLPAGAPGEFPVSPGSSARPAGSTGSGSAAGGFGVPGGTVHSAHPFQRPAQERDPVRRLRGRLTAPVTLWTAAGDGERAGLTVSSVLVAEPGFLLGLVGDEADVLDLLTRTGTFAVSVLGWAHRPLADAFSFLSPAPGGPFAGARWQETDWGPVPEGVATWAGCRVRSVREAGWSRLVEGALEHVELGDDGARDAAGSGPLLWQRGRFRALG